LLLQTVWKRATRIFDRLTNIVNQNVMNMKLKNSETRVGDSLSLLSEEEIILKLIVDNRFWPFDMI